MEGVNPKQAFGQAKPPHSTVPLAVLAEVGVGMYEGTRKYGRHNYRVTRILASVYYDATRRHLDSWFEGEDVDPDSGLSHVTKAICSLVVLRDSMINDLLADDRPPKILPWHKEYLQRITDEVVARHPVAKDPITEESHPAWVRNMESALPLPIIDRITPPEVREAGALFEAPRLLDDDFNFDGPCTFDSRFGFTINADDRSLEACRDRFDNITNYGGGFCACEHPEGSYDDPRTCYDCRGTIFSARPVPVFVPLEELIKVDLSNSGAFDVAPQHSVEHPLIGDSEDDPA